MVGNWEKVLWKKQAYADNYVPQGLYPASLQKNPNLRPYTYWPLVVLSCSITQHLAVIFVFLAVFVRLKEETLDPRSLVCLSVFSFFIGYITWNALDGSSRASEHFTNHLKTIKSAIMMFLALMSLSPVLRTLTAATSSDSIWALAAVLFSLNALLADYTVTEPKNAHEGLSSVLSINAAVSASVVLSSHLPTDASVFSLVLFSIQSFALFPSLRRRLQLLPIAAWLLTSLVMEVFAIWLFATLSLVVMWLIASVLVFVTFFAPAILLWAQRYKNILRGPWDVAVPKVN
ncbi:phosphatidylinositol N-acetylglucosaminyltransferase subunit C [Gymnopilus junonius]|uniref:Phosphatidylinositol N-acetylglucosaminyltransferase subunit C n=1 Tax=Gymnopilus junonius TaxID=109634 RepID=A0A9P5TFR4_GYMJU|nr:phosphatidylinositol N-acetylglucosaminyltransferase subunit C [Gymnopilus junonius]